MWETDINPYVKMTLPNLIKSLTCLAKVRMWVAFKRKKFREVNLL